MTRSDTSVFTVKQLKLIEWHATPKSLREPHTEGELAEVLGVTDRTFRNWKHKEGFWDAVYDAALGFVRQRLPEILSAVAEKAEEGSQQHAKLLLELTGKYVERQDVTSGGQAIGRRTIDELTDDELATIASRGRNGATAKAGSKA